MKNRWCNGPHCGSGEWVLVDWGSSGTGVTKPRCCSQNTLADRDAAVSGIHLRCPSHNYPHPPRPVQDNVVSLTRCYGAILGESVGDRQDPGFRTQMYGNRFTFSLTSCAVSVPYLSGRSARR